MLYNISNHAFDRWSEIQRNAAYELTTDDFVIDEPFPAIDPNATAEEVRSMARDMAKNLVYLSRLSEIELEAVMIQGEMTFVFAFVTAAKSMGIPCYAACSERKSKEVQNPDGSTTKTSTFEFVQFREY